MILPSPALGSWTGRSRRVVACTSFASRARSHGTQRKGSPLAICCPFQRMGNCRPVMPGPVNAATRLWRVLHCRCGPWVQPRLPGRARQSSAAALAIKEKVQTAGDNPFRMYRFKLSFAAFVSGSSGPPAVVAKPCRLQSMHCRSFTSRCSSYFASKTCRSLRSQSDCIANPSRSKSPSRKFLSHL